MYLNCSHHEPQPASFFFFFFLIGKRRDSESEFFPLFLRNVVPEKKRDKWKKLLLPSRRSQNENALAVIPFMERPVHARAHASGEEMYGEPWLPVLIGLIWR